MTGFSSRRSFSYLFLAAAFCLIWAVSFKDASAAKPIRIVVFGDSIVAGYGLFRAEDSLPHRLSHYLSSANIKIEVIPMGVSGDTTSSAIARLPQLIAVQPNIAVVALGGNDILRGIDPDITYNNLEIILKELERNGVYTLLAGMKAPPNMGYDYASRFNRVFPKIAERHNVLFYPFLLEGVAGDRNYNQRDGIHPNKEGADVIAKKMAPMLKDMVQNLKSSRYREELRLDEERHQRLREERRAREAERAAQQ